MTSVRALSLAAAVALTAAVFFSAADVNAHKTVVSPFTFSKDILPILQTRCLSCHRDGGANVSLGSYEAAKAYSVGIQGVLLAGVVEPFVFGPIPARREHRAITLSELDMLLTWSAGGTPEPGVPPAHAAHLPEHGGMLVAVADDSLHFEVAWHEQRRLRLYVTDASGRSLSNAELIGLKARAKAGDGGDWAMFGAAGAREYLEARIATVQPPSSMHVSYTTSDGTEQRHTFLFDALSVEPPDISPEAFVVPKEPSRIATVIEEQAREVEEMAAAGHFGTLYVPAAYLRELVLALHAMRQGARHDGALTETMRAVWLVHLSGDVGTPPHARAAVIELRRAVNALTTAIAP